MRSLLKHTVRTAVDVRLVDSPVAAVEGEKVALNTAGHAAGGCPDRREAQNEGTRLHRLDLRAGVVPRRLILLDLNSEFHSLSTHRNFLDRS